MFIYVIVNSETLKIYVGQHKGNNLRQYLKQKMSEARRGISTRSYLYASMRKHPKEVWSIHPLISDLQTRAECNKWERHYIKLLNAQHHDVGYNIQRGGEGFTGPHTPAVRRRISAKNKSAWARLSGAERQERSQRAKGEWGKPAYRQRLVSIIQERARTPENKQAFCDRLRWMWSDPIIREKLVRHHTPASGRVDGQKRSHIRWHVNRDISNPDCQLCQRAEPL